MQEPLNDQQALFIGELHAFGGVCPGLYRAAYRSIGYTDEAIYTQDLINWYTLEKGSLEAKYNNLLAAMMPRGNN